MADWLDLIARLRAYETQRAVRIASHCRIILQPHALALCPLSMAGEDSTIHIVAVGPIHHANPHIFWIPDPRLKQDEYILFRQLAKVLTDYFYACLSSDTFPQLWVSSQAGADLLDILADRLRFTSVDHVIRQLGEFLLYPAQRSDIVGQQTLIVAPHVLCQHWKTGQDDGRDKHLASVLTWLDPPIGQSFFEILDQMEYLPSGIKTNPAFDRQTLAPLVTQYGQARKKQVPARVLQHHAQRIRDALEPIVSRIFCQTQQAYQTLAHAGLPLLPSLAHLERRECREFQAFMQCVTKGIHIPRHDTFQMAVYGLVVREDAAQMMSALLLQEDTVERARGYFNGTVLAGCLAPLPPQVLCQPITRFQVVCNQSIVRVRCRDEWYWMSDLRLKVEIIDIGYDSSGDLLITFIIRAGMRCVHLPLCGTSMEFVAVRPDWHKLVRERKAVHHRLPSVPWSPNTHQLPSIPLSVLPSQDEDSQEQVLLEQEEL